jgi:hypothetical protein
VTTERTVAAVAAVALSACFLFAHESPRLEPPPQAPLEIRTGCALAETRCSRCHAIDRVLNTRVDSPGHWLQYVHRMRLQPQSGILPDEEDPIARCLVYRSFGAPGLAALHTEAQPP